MDAAQLFGILTLGPSEVAIPATALQEVVDWPPCFAPAAQAPGHALGTFNLRGQPIPAFDLASLLHPAGGPRPGGRIAVLRTNAGWLGLAVDGVADVVRAEAEALHGLASGTRSAAAPPPLVKTLLLQREGRRVVQVLDVPALLAQPGITLLAAPPPAAKAGPANRFLQQFLFFDCDGLRFCLEATAVREVIDQPALDRSFRLGDVYHGLVRLQGEAVPVLDLFNILALPGADAPKSKLLVLDVKGQSVALLISAVVAIQRLPAEQVMPLPGFGLRRPELFGGVVAGEATGRDALMLRSDAILLSHEALLRDRDVSALYRLHDGLDGAGGQRRRAPPGGERTAFLGFRAGEDYRVPLAQIQEIMPMPETILRLGSPDGVVPGMLKRRGAMIPLVDLRRLAGQSETPPGPASRLLLVREAEATYAFMIERTEAVEHLPVRGQFGQGAAGEGPLRAATRLLRVDAPEGETTMASLDLRALIGLLQRQLASA